MMGDESERMTLPIDMKKLEPALADVELGGAGCRVPG